MFPDVHSLLQRGPCVMHALSEGCEISIDPAERLHATMRVEMRSTGAGTTFVPASNRVFCQQLRAAHKVRTGIDPSEVKLAVADNSKDADDDLATGSSSANKSRTGVGLNPRLAWQNHKLKAFKQRVAPHRALTDQERAGFYANCKDEWESIMTPDEKKAWQLIDDAARIQRKTSIVAAESAQKKEFKPVWGAPITSSRFPVPMQHIVDMYKATSARDRSLAARHDPTLVIAGSSPSLVVEPDPALSSIFGCSHEKTYANSQCQRGFTPPL